MFISFFANTSNPRVICKDLPLETICDQLAKFDVRDEKDGPLYSFARFSPEYRADKNVVSVSAIVFDFDKGTELPDHYLNHFDKMLVFWHSSFSHTPDEPRWRLIVPLDRSVSPEEYYHCFDVLYSHLGSPAGIDLSCRSLSRAYFAPSCPTNRAQVRFAGKSGEFLIDPDKLLTKPVTPIGRQEQTKGRNDRLKEIATAMISRGELFEDIVDELVSFDEKNHEPSLFTDHKEGYRTTADKGAAKFVTNLHRSLKAAPVFRQTAGKVILKIKEPDPTLPEFIYNPPGLVGEVYRWILATSVKPQPELALGAALCAVGTAQGRKIRTATDLRTNIYCISLIETGGGKEHPRRAIQRIFERIGNVKRAYVEEVASDTAILEAISEMPSQTLLLDELGKVLSTTRSQAKAHLAGIPTLLLRLFSSANSLFVGRVYASRQNNRMIQHPNVSILGTATPESFIKALSSDSATDGFMNRLLFLPSRDPDPIRRYPTDFEPPASILNAFQKWEDLPYGSGALSDLPQNPPEPRVIPFTPEAQAFMEAQETYLRGRRAELRHESLAGTYVRVLDIAQRIALILSAPNPIDLTAIRYGYTLAMFSADYALNLTRNHISDNQTESNFKKVQNILDKKRVLTLNELYRATRFLTKPQRQDILNSLEVSGELVQEKTLSNGRAVNTLRYTPSEG